MENEYPSSSHYFKHVHSTNTTATSSQQQSYGRGVLRAIFKDFDRTTQLLPSLIRASIIAIRYDPTQPNYARAILSGPSYTAYEGGLFLFDIYLPPDYPTVPPMIQFLSTGRGMIRFHTHLYADGKVCLSLLGNFQGDSHGERWDKNTSSLGQLFLSIQTLILDDVHNPKRPMMTPSTNFLSSLPNNRTNDNIKGILSNEGLMYYRQRIDTVRHAMIAVLRCLREEAEGNNNGRLEFTSSFPEFHTLIRGYFLASLNSIMESLKQDIDVLRRYTVAATTADGANNVKQHETLLSALREAVQQLTSLFRSL